jgi:hypothetical protein
VAFATSLINNGLNWLRQLTGNGDPSAANQVIVSTSTSTSTWQQVNSAVIATAGVSDANMANQKVNQLNPAYTTFGGMIDKGSGFFDAEGTAVDAPVGGSAEWLVWQNRHWNWSADYRGQIVVDMQNQSNLYYRNVQAGAAQAWVKMWHSGNDGASSGLDADLLDGVQGAGYALVAAGVPVGAVVWFRTLAEVTSAGASWTRETNLDGRLPIGAGTTFSQTFAEATNYGANWTPSSGLTISAIAVTADTPFLVNVGTNTNVTTSTHTHPAPTLNGSGTAWLPPMRAGIWARRI